MVDRMIDFTLEIIGRIVKMIDEIMTWIGTKITNIINKFETDYSKANSFIIRGYEEFLDEIMYRAEMIDDAVMDGVNKFTIPGFARPSDINRLKKLLKTGSHEPANESDVVVGKKNLATYKKVSRLLSRILHNLNYTMNDKGNEINNFIKYVNQLVQLIQVAVKRIKKEFTKMYSYVGDKVREENTDMIEEEISYSEALLENAIDEFDLNNTFNEGKLELISEDKSEFKNSSSLSLLSESWNEKMMNDVTDSYGSLSKLLLIRFTNYASILNEVNKKLVASFSNEDTLYINYNKESTKVVDSVLDNITKSMDQVERSILTGSMDEKLESFNSVKLFLGEAKSSVRKLENYKDHHIVLYVKNEIIPSTLKVMNKVISILTNLEKNFVSRAVDYKYSGDTSSESSRVTYLANEFQLELYNSLTEIINELDSNYSNFVTNIAMEVDLDGRELSVLKEDSIIDNDGFHIIQEGKILEDELDIVLEDSDKFFQDIINQEDEVDDFFEELFL